MLTALRNLLGLFNPSKEPIIKVELPDDMKHDIVAAKIANMMQLAILGQTVVYVAPNNGVMHRQNLRNKIIEHNKRRQGKAFEKAEKKSNLLFYTMADRHLMTAKSFADANVNLIEMDPTLTPKEMAEWWEHYLKSDVPAPDWKV